MSINIYFNPLDTACKSTIGAIKQGETLTLNLFLLKDLHKNGQEIVSNLLKAPNKDECRQPNQKAFLLLNRDGEAADRFVMTKTEYGWTITLTVSEIGLYYYTFSIENEGFVFCGYQQIGQITHHPQEYMLIVYDTDYQTPEWFKGGVMYQIFPDRFYKQGTMPDIKGRISRKWGEDPYYQPNIYGKVLNNDFFGGNFKGIEAKLPYLRDLGVTVIYLNPVFEAASNHRYDTSDYMKIDPVLGTEEDFSSLVKTAEKHGIRIILDGVFNHTGDDSVYFNKYGHYPTVGAYQSKDSPYYSWYNFSEFPERYESWWGIDILPQVNENSKEYQEFIFGEKGVLKKWLKFGIGGYRLDVADELPDFFLKSLRKSVKESNENAVIIGEVWEDAATKIAYSQRREYLHGRELDSVMNYPLKEAIIGYIQSGNAANLLNTVRILLDHYPKSTVDCLMNILGTHDTARILTVLGGIYCHNKDEMAQKSAYLSETAKKKAIEKLKMAAVLQYTLPGIPCIYYGDENGQEGHIDPFCRRCFDWDKPNTDLQRFYIRLGEIRNHNRNIFQDGIFQEIHVEDGLFIYKREKENERIYIYVNNSSKRYIINLPETMTEIINDRVFEKQLEIKPYEYGVLQKSKTN